MLIGWDDFVWDIIKLITYLTTNQYRQERGEEGEEEELKITIRSFEFKLSIVSDHPLSFCFLVGFWFIKFKVIKKVGVNVDFSTPLLLVILLVKQITNQSFSSGPVV